eukprot:gene8303-8488_t
MYESIPGSGTARSNTDYWRLDTEVIMLLALHLVSLRQDVNLQSHHHNSPWQSDKTPTLSLFQRFESLTLGTPPATGVVTVAGTVGESAPGTAASPRAQGQQRTIATTATAAHQRRSVAFGTPSVLSYSPAVAAAPADGTPLWSNAGHTPYSLDGRAACGEGLRVCGELEGEQPESMGEADDHGSKSHYLFTSIITSTEQQTTPPISMDCPRTPVELATLEQLAIDLDDAPAKIITEQLECNAGAAHLDDEHAHETEPALKLPTAATAAGGLDSDSPSSFLGFDAGVQFQPDEPCSCSTPTWLSKGTDTAETQASPVDAAAGEPSAVARAAALTVTPARPAAGVPAVSVTPAAKEWLQLVAAGAVSGSHVPSATPRSKLKQPERTKSSRPAIPCELKQLLADPDAAAAAEAYMHTDALDNKPLGTCDVLSPVRARKPLQSALGAAGQVITPVRRSARTAKEGLAPAAVQPMLEAASYCYQPNAALLNREAVDVELSDEKKEISKLLNRPYKYGFKTYIESETFPKGLNEDVVRAISAKKGEPDWLLEFRLKAFRKWLTMEEPAWSDNFYPTIDYQNISFYSEPKIKEKKQSLDEVDPELLRTFDKLGIPLNEQKRLANVAVDAVFDSVSIATTFREELAKAGVIFCSISEAVKEYPELVRKHMGSVVPVGDNYYAALNSAVFSDGSFVYVPKGVRSPMELSTYFRINASETGQFERTLIVAEDDAYVSYLEGCTAPAYDSNQLHAAVVELSAGAGAEIKYSTVQNWYAGDAEGRGGIYNFVTKRGICHGDRSKISWTQVETGSAITWKYPSVVLKGDNSVGEFYSVALTNHKQQADTGTKMVHVGKNTRSRIVSKGISAGNSVNAYRGLVQIQPSARGARNYSQCDSMLIGDQAGANTYPYIQVREPSAVVEHEASTSKIGEDQLFYFQQRGVEAEAAVGMIISGFCREVFNELPLEFAAEVNELMNLKLEGSVG